MTERDIWFLVMVLIVATTLVVFVWRFVQSRRGGGKGGGAWYEGPWDDDRKDDDPR